MRKLLIVEDTPLNLDLLVQILEDNYALDTASDGEEGLAKAVTGKPDLILMDMSMPGIDGWEATRRLKADPAPEAIPVIALTSHAMAGDEERARAAGCQAFLTKPIDEDELFATIRQHLGEG